MSGLLVRRLRQRTERGAVSVLVTMLLASGTLLGSAAFGVDTARWYVEIQRVQKAADAAALAGVPYLPQDLPSAVTRAQAVAKRNGYDDASADVKVTVTKGVLNSQLRVTIESTIKNSIGSAIGVPTATIVQTAVADYQAPSPMGSPCNTFGNEPDSGALAPKTSVLPSPLPTNCTRTPRFWATIQGPEVDKEWGDRYQSRICDGTTQASTTTFECAGGLNKEYVPEGYFFVVKVQPAAVNKVIDLQLFDAGYVGTGGTSSSGSVPCDDMPSVGSFSDAANPFVNDGKLRYGRPTTDPGKAFCTNDRESGTALNKGTTTSFVLRAQTDTNDPMQAGVVNGTDGPCITQYKALTNGSNQPTTPSVDQLTSTKTAYQPNLAQTFHNWASFCTFTPARSGDYYIQVRSNVTTVGGTAQPNNGFTSLIYKGNTAAAAGPGNTTSGSGDNSFAIRAKTPPGLEGAISVAGYDRMPIYANGNDTTSTFNLIRVPTGAKGSAITFSFYDIGDGASSGTVEVIPPSDSLGTIKTKPFPTKCFASGGAAGAGQNVGTETSCVAPIKSATNNGAVETMTIPIPTDYSCTEASAFGCWYQVKVSFVGADVSDLTTWDATIVGDPIRLVE